MSQPSVVAITPGLLDEAVEVLAESFFNYPTMRYILSRSGPHYPSRLRSLVTYFAEARLAVGSPIMGVQLEEPPVLAAVALVDLPSGSGDLVGQSGELAEAIGVDAVDRLRSFEEIITTLEPKVGYYYLGMVGVLSGYRGRGFSRLLMDRVVEMSLRDEDSEGVLLTTEHEANVALYEGMGFRVLGEAHTPDHKLYSWTMFRPDSAA